MEENVAFSPLEKDLTFNYRFIFFLLTERAQEMPGTTVPPVWRWDLVFCGVSSHGEEVRVDRTNPFEGHDVVFEVLSKTS